MIIVRCRLKMNCPMKRVEDNLGPLGFSKPTWVLLGEDKDGQKYECMYSGSGRTPLFCALGAFVALTVAMLIKHIYILIAVSRPIPPALLVWASDSIVSRALTWQACFFFITTWGFGWGLYVGLWHKWQCFQQ